MTRSGKCSWKSTRLSRTLREQRLGALEATALLRTVMAEIDVAVFTFDGEQRLRLVNRAGEQLLGAGRGAAAGSARAEELGLAAFLEGESAAHGADDVSRAARAVGRAA